MFAAGCGPEMWSGEPHYPPEPELRPSAVLQREAEQLFREQGYEILRPAPRALLPYPHLGVTDVVFALRKDDVEYFGGAECRAQRPCRITEIVRAPKP